MTKKIDYVGDIYVDITENLEKMIDAAGAKIKMTGAVTFYDKEEYGETEWRTEEMTSEEYAIAVETEELSGPSIRKFSTRLRDIPGLGPMVVETMCYYDDMIDITCFEFELDTKSENYDRYCVEKYRQEIQHRESIVRNRLFESMKNNSTEIDTVVQMYRNGSVSPLASNSYDSVPYSVYFEDVQTKPRWNREGILEVNLTYEPVEGFHEYLVTKIEFTEISNVNPLIAKKFGYDSIKDKYVIYHFFRNHMNEKDDKDYVCSTLSTLPGWCVSSTDTARSETLVDVIDPENGEQIPLCPRLYEILQYR